ncbi:MAG: radical SAM protein [Nitrospiraceae bacterium]|nr:radical SAM protein [Nitrospiraceae bacterium]
MKALIISTNRNIYPEPVMPIGACMAAEAAQNAGHDVRLADLMFARDPINSIRSVIKTFNPDVVGLSIRNIDNNDLCAPVRLFEGPKEMARVIRQATCAPLVLGGAALSVMPRELLAETGADIAVLADGERVFPAVLEAYASGKGPLNIEGAAMEGTAMLKDGVYVSTPPARNKSEACFRPPRYEKWLDKRRYLSMLSAAPMLTKAGCHFECVYCTYKKLPGGVYELMDPAEAAHEIERLSKSGFRDIEFVDNVFNSPPGHAISVCEEVIRRNIRARLHTVELNPLFITEELVRRMERAGFAGVGITAESASDTVLAKLNKGFGVQHVIKAAEILRKSSLPCLWIFMLGGPGENEKTVRETLRFAKTYPKPQDAVFFNIGVRIYPGTGLERIARQEGLLSLSASEMLEPVFYLSPGLNFDWLFRGVESVVAGNLNFIDVRSMQSRHLPRIRRLFRMLGIKQPLWRHTARIRKGLRLLGLEAK